MLAVGIESNPVISRKAAEMTRRVEITPQTEVTTIQNSQKCICMKPYKRIAA